MHEIIIKPLKNQFEKQKKPITYSKNYGRNKKKQKFLIEIVT